MERLDKVTDKRHWQTFGIYQPPPLALPLVTQDFGLNILNQPTLSDFTVICSDGVRLSCSRKILEDRWPWFKEELQAHIARKQLELQDDEELTNGHEGSPSNDRATVTPYHLLLPESSTVGMAILQYFYTLNLITPLQHNIQVLVSMLLFAREYDLDHLRALVAHALHTLLPASSANAAIIYEAAALGGCIALQTRALKIMMNVRPCTYKHRR